MVFSAQELRESLSNAPPCEEYVVALSGGMDSVVLLHALCELRDMRSLTQTLSAIHINHGLQADADRWQRHCIQLCDEKDISLHCESVSVSVEGSLENAARSARYKAFESLISPKQVLLQAHHLDDQLETLLLRLSRGAGTQGLGAIPQERVLVDSYLFRPLLQYSRRQLTDYAQHHRLSWAEDESNANEDHDRNFLRHSVLPLIEQRWPGYRKSWNKSLELLAESSQLTKQLAAIDLQYFETPEGSLDLSLLRQLDFPRQRNVLRYWLDSMGLDMPGWKQLNSLLHDLLDKTHTEGALSLQDYEVRVFADQLFVLIAEPASLYLTPGHNSIALTDGAAVTLPDNGRLQVNRSSTDGLNAGLGELEIRYRKGGEALQLPGRPSKSLKQLFQEMTIPPWLRDRVPLLYHSGSLVCVPGIGVAQDALAVNGSRAFAVDWQMPELTPIRKDS